MFCRKCGKEIDDEAVVCPHCGVPTINYYGRGWGEACTARPQAAQPVCATPPAAAEKPNNLGIAAFVVSVASIWLGELLCLPAIAGLILSIVAMKKRKDCNKYNGFAVAGLAVSIFATFLWVMVWTMVIILILSQPLSGIY